MSEPLTDSGTSWRAELDDAPHPLPPELPSKPFTLMWSRLDSWALVAILGATLLIYGRTFWYGFTNWDDVHFLVHNPVVRGLSWENLKRAFTPGGVPRELIFIPLTYVSHMVEAELFGLRPGVVHATNVLLHTLNGMLVYLLCRRLSDSRRVAVVAALLFVLHPLQVETVAWAMGRKDLLAALAGLPALLAYHRHLEERRPGWFALSLACFTVAMLVKPTMIVLPALLILMECYVKGPPQPWRWGSFLPFVLIGLLGYWINTRMPIQPLDRMEPLWFRLLCLPWLGFEWVRRFFLLGRPLPYYSWPDANQWPLILAGGLLFVVLLTLVGGWAYRRRISAGWFGLWFFAIGMAPNALLVLKPREFITADRYGYFPLIGIVYMIGVGWQRVGPSWRRLYSWALLVGAAVALLFSWQQVEMWSSSIRLWTRVDQATGNNPTVLNNLGMSYIDASDPAAAVPVFERGLAADPHHLTLRLNLIMALQQTQRYEHALEVAEETLRLFPRKSRAWETLVDAHFQLGVNELTNERPAKAREAFEVALGLREDAPTHINLGQASLQLGHHEEAVAHFRRALALGTPYAPMVNFLLGGAWEALGEAEEAAEAYRQAVALDPTFQEAAKALERVTGAPVRE